MPPQRPAPAARAGAGRIRRRRPARPASSAAEQPGEGPEPSRPEKADAEGAEDCTWGDASTEAGEGTPQPSCPGSPQPSCPAKPPPAPEAAAPAERGGPAASGQPVAATPGEGLVERGLARILPQMVAMAAPPARKSVFQCAFPPSIRIQDYVARVLRFSQCHEGCAVVSLVYLDRLLKRHPWITVGPLTCHRLVLVSVVLAIKFYDDTYYSNSFYAKVGGVQLKDLNNLERIYLQLIEYRLCVDPREYDEYHGIMMKAAQLPVAAGKHPAPSAS